MLFKTVGIYLTYKKPILYRIWIWGTILTLFRPGFFEPLYGREGGGHFCPRSFFTYNSINFWFFSTKFSINVYELKINLYLKKYIYDDVIIFYMASFCQASWHFFRSNLFSRKETEYIIILNKTRSNIYQKY